jgi:hypothetical protein
MGKGDAVSDAGDIITALTADVTTAVSGVTVTAAAVNFADLKAEDLPYCRLVLADYSVEILDWGQEQRTWTVAGLLAIDAKGGTREAMQVLLDGIRDQVFADTTLGGSVERASCATIVPESHPEDVHVYGHFSVQAEKVV